MNFEDIGIVLSVRKYGERAGLLELLSKNHGRHVGLARNYQSKINQPILQPGNTISFIWKARLSEHLGTLTFELDRSRSGKFINNRVSIVVLQTLLSHLRILPERESFTELFNRTSSILDFTGDYNNLIKGLVLWELFFFGTIRLWRRYVRMCCYNVKYRFKIYFAKDRKSCNKRSW